MRKTITFIGAGNMSSSLIAGLVQDKADLDIRVSDPNDAQIHALQKMGQSISTYNDNNKAVENSDIVVLAVKPQIMEIVCRELASAVKNKRPLIISIAAGITENKLNQWLGGTKTDRLPIVRCMPNTPALVQSGMTGLFANDQVSEQQHSLAESILRAVGITLWFKDEDKLNAVTAISGSGPAYFFLVMEAMEQAAQKLGLTEKDARLLVLQTAFGSAKLALESHDDAATLRQKVTSKGGTTEAAINTLVAGGISGLFEKALIAARDRSIELS
jgi:pyrroline-5-carboxylate reductase